MSVYVDPLARRMAIGPEARRVGAKYGHRWCHLFADSAEELHVFAAKIGLRRSWFQVHPSVNHYDLVPPRREAAVAADAIELDRRAAVLKWREIRELAPR